MEALTEEQDRSESEEELEDNLVSMQLTLIGRDGTKSAINPWNKFKLFPAIFHDKKMEQLRCAPSLQPKNIQVCLLCQMKVTDDYNKKHKKYTIH